MTVGHQDPFSQEESQEICSRWFILTASFNPKPWTLNPQLSRGPWSACDSGQTTSQLARQQEMAKLSIPMPTV